MVTYKKVEMPDEPDDQEAFAAITRVINAWDPQALIAQGAPEDEYEAEARDICNTLTAGHIGSEQELAIYISTVCEKWFGEHFAVGTCAFSAHLIWAWWQEHRGETASE